MRVHWYHRATGKALEHDPGTAQGFAEVARLDAKAKTVEAAGEALSGTYAALWLLYRKADAWTGLRPRTRTDYQAVRDWLGAAADKMALAAITPPQIERLRDRAISAKGRRFGNYVVQVLRLTFAWGVLRGHMKTNPAAGVKLTRKPRGTAQVNRAWTLAEVEAFLTACPRQLAAPFALGLFAGMRQGDALRVTWSAYDGQTIRWTASKNGEPCAVPVTDTFRAILNDAKARRGKAVQIAVTLSGSPWSESGFRATFFKRLRALRDAGAVASGCTFHGLRHTIGAGARDDGESDSRVAAAIGDRSTAMAAIYGRDADRATAQAEVMAAHQKRFANIDWQRPVK